MNALIIDVREPYEYADGHVKSAINLPLGQIMLGATELADYPKDTKLVVYCNSGNRSGIAKNILQNLGYNNVTNGINKEQVEAMLGKNHKN